MNDYIKLAKNNLEYVTTKDDLFSFRLLLSLTSLLWAALIFWSMISTDVYHLISPTQDLMNKTMSPNLWWAAFVIQGLFGFIGVLINPKSRLFEIFDSLLGALLYCVTSSLIIVGYLSTDLNIPPIWSPQIILSIFSIWALLRNKYVQR